MNRISIVYTQCVASAKRYKRLFCMIYCLSCAARASVVCLARARANEFAHPFQLLYIIFYIYILFVFAPKRAGGGKTILTMHERALHSCAHTSCARVKLHNTCNERANSRGKVQNCTYRYRYIYLWHVIHWRGVLTNLFDLNCILPLTGHCGRHAMKIATCIYILSFNSRASDG